MNKLRIDRHHFALFLGGEPKKIMTFFDEAKERDEIWILSGNFAALFFSMYYFAYRKMWKVFAGFLLFDTFVVFIETVFDFETHRSYLYMFGFFAAFMANSLFLSKANKIYIQLKYVDKYSAEEIEDRIAHQASGSYQALAVGIMSSFICVFLAIQLGQILRS